MEKPRTRNGQLKEKRLVHQNHNRNSSSEPTHDSLSNQVRLAALAISLNVRLRSSDMPLHLQEHALRYTRSLVGDPSPKSRHNPTHIARDLKKEFDSVYGPAWHCVVGTSFGSFVTHTPGGFVYFSIDSFSVLLFKTEVQLVTEPPP
ncbi:hypothetical protein L6164_018458 [Bauhinia variegata]|uniref:Uncharacterized protein n=1 Tax=Bauhinia variegata TaxID=167791 RepID=A0ACB9NBT5_BAUVA|nr:hypothetical protein L6164_018458 [Bauhinia variegata]